ncbi:hypothetical protein LCGC14_1265570 [marine sediment metagenome]|uniref:Uncharacterized protein n=1 Tax=marine sediment metagenome TaxID=412755 RepID=A0A0F9KZL6_9ZZZZ
MKKILLALFFVFGGLIPHSVFAASGDTLVVFTPLHNEPTALNFATLDTRNQHPVLDFRGDAIIEEAVFTGVMPRYYGSSGITIYIHYSMGTATSGNIDWGAQFERIGDQQQDIDDDGWGGTNTTNNTTVPGTSGDVDIINITFTDGVDMDSIAVGESFRLKVLRDGLTDTSEGDAELVAIEIQES